MLLKFKDFVNSLLEGGNAVNSRPLSQKEVVEAYEYVVKHIFPLFGLTGDGDAKPIGSFKKKIETETSGDVDIAVLSDRIAGVNNLSLEGVLDFIEKILQKNGYETSKSIGFNQVSFSLPINGKPSNGFAQIDLMLTDNLQFSDFMYYSPDFTKSESKYKGLYRNLLLMCIINNLDRKTTKTTDKGETAEYQSYVLRLNQGIVKVTKSFEGSKGLVKTAKLLKDQDIFITNTPDIITELAFGNKIKSTDILTFENIWKFTTDTNFKNKDKLEEILNCFSEKINQIKVPIPIECINDYPNIFK